MPPPLPERYSLEVRLGRDHDVEQWLATDTALDRPVLIRVLGPETSMDRRQAFLDETRAAAAVTHVHLISVFAAGLLDEGAFSVTEWAGGVSMADRLTAGETMPVDEFFPNAAGLADALAALHATGGIHGAIDPGAIYYAGAHPAKLGGFGRPHSGATVAEDLRALAETLEISVTGRPVGTSSPSQVVDGIPSAVDEALTAAAVGDLDAAGLARALRTAPQIPTTPAPAQTWSWRWLAPAAIMAILAVGIVAIGLVLPSGPESPVLFPANPSDTSTTLTLVTTTTTATTPPLAGEPATIVRAFSYDPNGDGSEHEEHIPRILDGDPTTAWRTERYFDPLPRLKAGVGVAIEVEGAPTELQVTGISDGTAYSIMWAASLPAGGISGWERLASGTVSGGRIATQVPERIGGLWLLWFTDLPAQNDPEGFYAFISEVRFRP